MFCSRRCIVITIDGALYNVDVDVFKKITFKIINGYDIDIFINDASNVERLFKITKRLELRF
jgi:hypothetical protein